VKLHGVNEGVFWGELMTANAMRLLGVVAIAVTHLVKLIRRVGVPPQILQPVVRLDAVVVAALQALGPGTDERLEDQSVDRAVNLASVTFEIYVPIALVHLGLDGLTLPEPRSPVPRFLGARSNHAVDAADAAPVGHLVHAFVIQYRAPCLALEEVRHQTSAQSLT
jgi:small basic protein